jgi:hypothetical protein
MKDWLAQRLAERSTALAIGGAIMLGASVIDGSLDWHQAVKPAAAALIAFLFPETTPPSAAPSPTA